MKINELLYVKCKEQCQPFIIIVNIIMCAMILTVIINIITCASTSEKDFLSSSSLSYPRPQLGS